MLGSLYTEVSELLFCGNIERVIYPSEKYHVFLVQECACIMIIKWGFAINRANTA